MAVTNEQWDNSVKQQTRIENQVKANAAALARIEAKLAEPATPTA